VALAYFGAAKLGLALAFATPSVTAVWPPAGIALAALVLGGRGMWPGVAAGAFLANVTTDVPLYTALGITAGNTLEAVAGATLLRWFGFRPSLRRLGDTSALVLASVLSTPVAATIGVASLSLGDSLSDGTLTAWRVWWLGDLGGDLLIAPFLFVAVTHWPYREVPGRLPEALALLGGLVAAGIVIFGGSVPVAYLAFPFVIWAAIRFLQPGATTAALVVSAIVVAFTANGSGQFIQPSEDDSLLLAQTFAAVVGLSGLVLATLTSQLTRAEQRTRRVAHAFQAELLPPALPQIPSLETAAWYRAGAQEQEVGGDFYDVFEASKERWFAVIGDVCGKGPEAASLTSMARYTLRAVAREPIEPSEALRTLNDAILEQRSDRRFMTVALASVNGDGESVAVSNGGHPLPWLVRRDGEVEEVGGAGTLLGIYADPTLEDHSVRLRPGEALVLFTDGLNESRDLDDDATLRIRETLRSSAGSSAHDIAERLRRLAPAQRRGFTDDVAVLVLRRPGTSGHVDGAEGLRTIAIDLEPVPESTPLARRAIAPLERELDPILFEDLRLVVSELVTNSVRHAGLGRSVAIALRVTHVEGALRVEVTDPGVGFEPGTPRPSIDGRGGWGLYIVERLADRWGVKREGERITVWLEWDLDRSAEA
jgi:serine phosphatase RsbU (regulator of sigma subunit)/anti-sigma regulatory factor (Ser/Thr protein kinase)